jgi:cell wall-associated NlpC family hydrolase
MGIGIGCNYPGASSVGQVWPGETATQARAVRLAAALLGVPYVWGGESTSGFDCSGLVQYVFRADGVLLPRVAQDQFDAGPQVPPGHAVVPGDLLFFGYTSTHDIHHVGMFVGNGLMLDAYDTGTVVRFDPISAGGLLVGVTDPGGSSI